MKSCVAYMRVSTVGQSEDGLSMDSQRAKITEWCADKGYSPEFFQDVKSGGGKHRPAFKAAVARARQLDCVMVVWASSRLARNFTDTEWMLAQFHKRGSYFFSISEMIDSRTAAGRQLLDCMMMVAKAYRAQVVEHTQQAMDYLKSKGMKTGRHAPYGYAWGAGNKKVPVRREIRCLDLIFKMRGMGKRLVEIANELNRRQFYRRNNTPWKSKNVAKVFHSYPDYSSIASGSFKWTHYDSQEHSQQSGNELDELA
jgi:DNA invertase Pin-like site-specific DNA recombinase